MYEIKVTANFSSAHNLRDYKGKCEKLHGHNWAAEAVFSYETIDKSGIALDFRKAKQQLRLITERLDHSYLNELPFFKKANPTSETIAKFLYDSLKKRNKNVRRVSVWENENSCATYSED